MYMVVVDSVLVVYDHMAPRHLVLVNWQTGNVLAEVGRSGEGPQELRSVTHLDVQRPSGPGAAVVWAFDATLRRALRLDMGRPPDSTIDGVRRFQVAGYPDKAHFGDDAVLLGGMFQDAPLMVLRANSDQAEPRGRYPLTESQYPDRGLRYTVNKYAMTVRPAGDMAALAYIYLGQIDFYTTGGRLVRSVRSAPQVKPPPIVYRHERPLLSEDAREAYYDIASSDHFVYAVFCGCSRTERQAGMEHFEVHVLSWQGQLVARLVLDKMPSGGIAVLPDDSRLFLSFTEPVPGVGEWDLGGLTSVLTR